MNNRKNSEESKRTYKACCDIFHSEDKVFLRLEMPGVTDKDLDVRVDDDTLIIKGVRNTPEPNGSYLLHEIKAGDFYHEFTLDDTIDRGNIDASIKNGVVTLVLGIRESVKPRKIEVKAG